LEGFEEKIRIKNYSLPFSTGLKSGAGNGMFESTSGFVIKQQSLTFI